MRRGVGAFCSGLLTAAVITVGSAAPAYAAHAAVSPVPASGTPQLAATGSTEQVRQLVQCGGIMYAVGSFTSIQWNGSTYTRRNVFSFGAAAPFPVHAWNPDVNGEVNSIALNANCSVAYLGGTFTSVHGSPASNIAAVSAKSGDLISGFRHSANAAVETLVMHGGHLLAGGYFTAINGSTGDAYMASLDPATGADDGFVGLHISGSYHYCASPAGKTLCTGANSTRVYNQQLSHSGRLDLVEGDFTSVGGRKRQQIFMLNVSGPAAVVSSWTSTEFNEHCWITEPFYLRAASWSPDDSTIYTASTGFHLANWNGSFPLPGLCDTAAAFPSTHAEVHHTWINPTGCDSLYSTAADSGTAYFGGHERWSENPDGCNTAGSGAMGAPGMEGLSPATGLLTFNPTRSRGLGADDMLVTGAGLWIASDNYHNVSGCGGVTGHAGICFFPNA